MRRGLPLVVAHADHVERFVRYTRDLAPMSAAGLRQLLELASDLDKALENTARCGSRGHVSAEIADT